MKTKLKISKTVLSLILLMSLSCNDYKEDIAPQSSSSTDQAVTFTKLGKQLENPYSVDNMKKVLDTIRTIHPNVYPDIMQKIDEIDIKSTDVYIRFLPKDSTQYDLLRSDTTMIFYDYPLDYEIKQQGEVYIDPSIGARKPQWLYTVVKPNKQFPKGIEYEILSELFIPQNHPDYDISESNQFGTLSNILDRMDILSLYRTNNLSEEELRKIKDPKLNNTDSQARKGGEIALGFWDWLLPSYFTPSGRIRVWDDFLGTHNGVVKKTFVRYDSTICGWKRIPAGPGGRPKDIPLSDYSDYRTPVYCKYPVYSYTYGQKKGSYIAPKGVLARARLWFVTKTGEVGYDGRFKVNGKFRWATRYKFYWERYEFTIREKPIIRPFANTADVEGPKQKSPWYYDIKDDGKDLYHSIIFRAAFHYYYGNIKGLKRPPQNSTWKPQMKLRAFYHSNDVGGRHNPKRRTLGLESTIYIYNPQNSSKEIYATTIHELAHASHWELRKDYWDNTETAKKVKESWATGVEWELTRMVYNNPKIYKGITWTGDEYTLIVADMIDGPSKEDTRINYGFIDSRDEVSGYTIKQIEDVLSNVSSWNEWRDNIKDKYNNPSESKLDKLFKAYE